MGEALSSAKAEIDRLTAELAEATDRIRELVKLTTLQGDDLKRLLALMKKRGEPNQPERVSDDALQLAFKQILEGRSRCEELERVLTEAEALAKDADSDTPPKEVEEQEVQEAPPALAYRPADHRGTHYAAG